MSGQNLDDPGQMTNQIQKRYQRFAEVEAHGTSDVYERMALEVAQSASLRARLAELPKERQQPNLFFAAIRMTIGLPDNAADLDQAVADHWPEICQVMMTRTTQTNEPGRCACFLPVLSKIEGPLALLEVGASAGLCLLPDRYGYDYGVTEVVPEKSSAADTPVFPCRAGPDVPIPNSVPNIVWRAGLDLNPLDVRSDADMDWLKTLVWPGQEARLRRLEMAVELAKDQPPSVEMGDILTNAFEDLARSAPFDAQLIVFHTAVFNYIDNRDERDRFSKRVADLGAIWIANEAPRVFPDVARRVPSPPPHGKFLLAVDGKPTAWTGPHGQSIDWISD